MRQARVALVAALLCTAGCQHDMAFRAVDAQDAYAPSLREVDGFVIESDTRRVSLDFRKPPVKDTIDSDMVFAYLSIPLHPLRGFEWDNPGIGFGWSNTAVSFTEVFEPFPRRGPLGMQESVRPGDLLIADPADRARRPAATPNLELDAVDPRYADYAAALRENVYRSGGGPTGEVMARTLGGTAPFSPAAAEDD